MGIRRNRKTHPLRQKNKLPVKEEPTEQPAQVKEELSEETEAVKQELATGAVKEEPVDEIVKQEHPDETISVKKEPAYEPIAVKEEPADEPIAFKEEQPNETDATGTKYHRPTSYNLRQASEAADPSEASVAVKRQADATLVKETKIHRRGPQSTISTENPKKLCRFLYSCGFHDIARVYTVELLDTQDPDGPEDVILLHIKLRDNDYYREIVDAYTIMRDIRHPNITITYEVYKPDANNLWVMTENVFGSRPLKLFGCEPRSEEVVAAVFKGLCLALQHLHEHSIVFRKMNAGSIAVTEDGGIQLMLLSGCIKVPERTNRCVGKFGTTPRVAPEVTAGKGYNTKADIWSLGITLIEIAERAHPWFSQKTTEKAQAYIAKKGSPQLQFRWTKDTKDFLSRCLCIDENERACASELLEHEFLRKACSAEKLSSLVDKTTC